MVGCVPPPCAALRRRLRCAEPDCVSSEMRVTANMSSARPGKVSLGIVSALKVNIIEQAFTWYPIRRSITNTAGQIQVLNSSDVFGTPGTFLKMQAVLTYAVADALFVEDEIVNHIAIFQKHRNGRVMK